MVMVYATGHLSGAHINPAVTIAFAVTRHFPRREVAAYVAGQLAGAILAALCLLAVWPGQPADLGATMPSVGNGSALVYEAIMTAFLMFVIMAVATDTRASMNPARSIAPALATGNFASLWIYVLAPVVGALLGAGIYQALRGEALANA